MKKLLILSVLSIFLLVFQSCNDDTEPVATVDKSLILGEWVLKDVYSKNGAVENTVNGQKVKATITIKGKNYSNTQKFTENPNKLISTGGMTIAITTSWLNQSQTVSQEIPNQTVSGEWSIEGNKLTSKVNQNNRNLSSTVTIDKLTESSLILNQNLSDSEQFTGMNGVKITGNLFFVYTKK